MMAGNGDLSTAKLAAIGPVRYVRGRYALKFVTFSAVNFRRHVVSFSLAVAASCFQDLESNDAQRYSLMKTIRFSRSGVRFPLHYDECHMRTCLLGWLSSSSRSRTAIDAVWWWLMAVIGFVNDYRHQSCASRRPIVARLLVHFFDATWRHTFHLGMFMMPVKPAW